MSRSVKWEIAISALFFILLGAAYTDARAPVANVSVEVLQKPYADGGALVYRWSGEIRRNCRGAFRREIRQGGEVYHLPDRTFTWLPSGEWSGPTDASFVVTVPMHDLIGEISDGPASYHVVQVGSCNRVQYFFGGRVESAFPPVVFEVSSAGAL